MQLKSSILKPACKISASLCVRIDVQEAEVNDCIVTPCNFVGSLSHSTQKIKIIFMVPLYAALEGTRKVQSLLHFYDLFTELY